MLRRLLVVLALLHATAAFAGVFDPNDDPRVRACLLRVRASPDSLGPRRDLADLYRDLGTIEGRRLAGKAYAELLRQHPRDPDLLLAFAELRMDQGFYRESEKLFRKAARLDSRSVPASFGIAELALQDYRRYLDEKRLKTANAALDRVLALDPDHKDALFFRVFTRLAEKDTAGARATAQRLTAAHPGDAWAWLLRGTVAQGSRRYSEARDALEKAAGLVSDPLVRDAFETLRYVSWRAEAVRETSDVAGRDRLERDFWKRIDPTPATSTNERRLEHLRRIVLAELYYAVPAKRIRGWNTAAGEAIVRFGPPISRSIGIGEMGVAGFQPPALNQVHRIDGKDVELNFVDRNLSGLWLQPWNGGEPTEMDIAMNRSESSYEYPVDGPRLPVTAQRAQFRGERGTTRLELVFAVPDSGGPASRWSRQVMLYDRSFDSLGYSEGWIRPAVHARNRRHPGPDYAVDFVSMPVSSSLDSIWIGSQVSDTLSRGYGSGFECVPVRRFSRSTPELSDILLMDRAGFEADPGPLGRAGGWAVPSPDAVYLTGENVPFYFEAYNLQPGDEGLVHYDLRITIGNARKPNPRMSRPALINLKTPPRPRVETRFTESARPGDLKRLLDLEVGALPPGAYRLTLTLEDREGGGSCTSSTIFRVVAPPELSERRR